MFESIDGLLNTLFNDLQSTFITVFAIGLLVCAVGIWAGDEQATPKFKRGLMMCAAGVVVFILAQPIVNYISSNL